MKHGWYYFYRVNDVHTDKHTSSMFPELKGYLDKMFENCPHEYFVKGPRSSSLKFPIDNCAIPVPGHDTCSLAEVGLQMDRYSSAHSKVEVFMLENDPRTVAVEVPIWLEPSEIENYMDLFDTQEPLTGHIDILRVEEGKIWIWDYKPKAHKEKHAHVQTLFYAIMLSRRTGIGLENFRCGYFDHENCYVFKPEEDMLNTNGRLSP